MRVLFAVSHAGFLRNFESGLQHLLARGHEVHVHLGRAADAGSVTGTALQVLDRLVAEPGRLSWSAAAQPMANAWSALAGALRTARDYWRYLEPVYDDAPLLRKRVLAEAPAFSSHPLFRWTAARRCASALAHAVERDLPVPEAAFDLIDRHHPDVLVVTPLIYIGSDQVYLARAARQRGIPVVYASGSWDHLTTKGLVQEEPDVTLVWNEAQITEAVSLHGLPRQACRATGAQAFDHWFGRAPSVDRATFCRNAGLPADAGPILLYLCSSTFIAGDERTVVREWLAAVRASAPPLGEAAVIVRPHPQNADPWKDERFEDGRTVVWPRQGANPVSAGDRDDFFHSIYFSAAVVGVNTSAQIEAAIVGRPVFSVLTGRYADTQTGTLHFRHLRSAGGGLLHTASSFEEHTGQLAAALEGAGDGRSAAFVAAFVRPGGLDKAAGALFADAVESARPRLRRRRPGLAARLIGPMVAPLAGPAEAAGNLRATRAASRFQAWFVPAGPELRAHGEGAGLRRIACAAATAAEVERAVGLRAELDADPGGRMLLCVPDGSPAGAAAKASRSRLPRCTVVGLPPTTEGVRLLLLKFRPDVVTVFAPSEGGAPGAALVTAARETGVPVRVLDGPQDRPETLAAGRQVR